MVPKVARLGCTMMPLWVHKLHVKSLFQRVCVIILHVWGLVVRKPVFGVSDKASFKPVSSASKIS